MVRTHQGGVVGRIGRDTVDTEEGISRDAVDLIGSTRGIDTPVTTGVDSIVVCTDEGENSKITGTNHTLLGIDPSPTGGAEKERECLILSMQTMLPNVLPLQVRTR